MLSHRITSIAIVALALAVRSGALHAQVPIDHAAAIREARLAQNDAIRQRAFDRVASLWVGLDPSQGASAG